MRPKRSVGHDHPRKCGPKEIPIPYPMTMIPPSDPRKLSRRGQWEALHLNILLSHLSPSWEHLRGQWHAGRSKQP